MSVASLNLTGSRTALLVSALLIVQQYASLAPMAHAQGAATAGLWSPVLPWPVEAVHAHLLPTGKVMFYGFDDDARLWDPATGAFTAIARAGFNIFCTGHTFLPDGRLFLAGGHISNSVGLPNSAIYDPFTDTWTNQPNMNAGRWYPTTTTLSNGDVLVVSGDIDPALVNPLPQVWQSATGTWRDLTTAQLGLPLYPFMFLMTDGRVFQAGPNQNARYLDTSGTGAWTPAADSQNGLRDYGSAVLYDEGKVLIVGGGDPPTNSAEVIDLNAATPAWRAVSPMVDRRRHMNATLLPDGKVLVTGGSRGNGFDNAIAPVLSTELWDPATETFATLPSITEYRGYHGIALLLPDGRVLSTSGDTSGTTAEIYSPAYLFKGPRPAVTAAPVTVSYGQAFSVTTPDAARIAAVNLIRLGSVTHAFNMDQRINRLPFVPSANGLTITSPAGPTFAPAGYYMLFLVDTTGVPSVASFVQITAGPTAQALTVTAPVDGAQLSGTTAFKGFMNGMALNTYSMFWQVDGDNLNPMADSLVGGPHKEALVDVSNWNWRGAGPYALNFVARDAAGQTLAEKPVNITVGAPPAAPTNLTAAVASATQINLSWTDNATDETAFQIERCQAPCTTFAQIAQVAADVVTYNNTGLVAGTTYNYRLRAVTPGGTSAFSNVATVTTGGAPAAPTALAATAMSSTQVNLSWKDNAANETAYRVERCAAGCSSFTQIAQLAANVTTYNNAGLAAGTTYTYRVRAANAQGTSGYSNNAAATTPGPPAAPQGLSATSGARGVLNLIWTDASGNESGFKIERCTAANCGSFSQIAQVGVNVATYSNTGLKRGTVYRYRVRSHNATGQSAYSNIVTATAP